MKPVVGIVMGSDSDLPVMNEASRFLKDFGIPHSVEIVSAHRTGARMVEYAASAKKNGIKVIIAGAGGAAHLPGMIASFTPLPVIGVPVKTKSLEGLDSLLSVAQMPPGVPVATVAINGAKNAAILACQILGTADPKVASKVASFKKNLEKEILEKDKSLQAEGMDEYLKRLTKAR